MSKGWYVFVSIALALATAGPAAAQIPPPAPGGAFEQLSPGNQKIARAIFESQRLAPTPPTSPKPLSLDQIAALKQHGRGWGGVYKDLRGKGLVQDKNLGQAVSRFNHEHKSSGLRSVEITTASGKTVSVGGTGHNGGRGPTRSSFSSDDDGRGSSLASAHAGGGQSDSMSGGHGGGSSHGGGGGKERSAHRAGGQEVLRESREPSRLPQALARLPYLAA